ncbi:CLUMA_CG018783, isoform A [Clunio marinus]|uniref:Gustatory receptor n=1 Tax=Clunio marinus TaxID=568069 RepID=A0A1J1J1E3_9DIPT|nr:CLUMA_CG018783, isoform A [Clunio marinus]
MHKNEKNIYHSNRTLFLFTKVFGAAPYQINKESLKIEMKVINHIFFVLSISAWVVVGIYRTNVYLQVYEEAKETNSLASDQLWEITLTIQAIMLPFLVAFNVSKRQHIENLMISLKSFDDCLKSLKWRFQIFHGRNYWIPSILIIPNLIYLISFEIGPHIYYHKDSEERSWFVLICDMISYLTSMELWLIFYLQFVVSVWCINTRFDALLKNFRFILRYDFCVKEFLNLGSTYNKDTLNKISLLYDILADIVEEVNSIFTKQLIPIFLIALLMETGTIHLIIELTRGDVEEPIKWILINSFYWFVFLIAPSLVSIYVADGSSNKRSELSNLVENVSNSCDDEDIFQEILSLKVKISNRPVIFTCGLFDINGELALSIFGTIASYLIIIIQFEQPAVA